MNTRISLLEAERPSPKPKPQVSAPGGLIFPALPGGAGAAPALRGTVFTGSRGSGFRVAGVHVYAGAFMGLRSCWADPRRASKLQAACICTKW